jgi:DNA recombination protein RmuC
MHAPRMITALLVLLGLVVGIALGAAGAWRLARQQRSTEEAALRETFTAVSAQALRENNEAFLALADARLTRGREHAEDAMARDEKTLAALLAPVQESLGRVDAQLRAVENQRERAYGGLLEQVEGMRRAQADLRAETTQLVSALRAPQVRGRWGEMQLRRVVEAAGAVEHVHFAEQVHSVTDDGVQRPDLVVTLADGKHIVVDAKAPFAAWLEAMEATDETQRADRMKAHARHLRNHVKQLSDKGYAHGLATSPEFVVLFVPADTFLDAALRADPTLLDDAFARDVVLATPSTLVALLRTVGYCWRSDRLAENAQAISAVGGELYARLGTLGGHLDKLGGSLSKAVGSYNEAVGSLETRVLVTARKLADLHVSEEPLPRPRALHDAPRPLAAPELTERAG